MSELAKTAEAPFSVPNLPSRFKNDFSTFTSALYLPRLQLEGSSSKLVKKHLIQSGHYSLVTGRDSFEDLGEKVDVLVLDHRTKATDLTDTKNIINSYDKNSETFKTIVAAGRKKGYLYGLEFLLYVPGAKNDQKFCTLFMGNATSRVAARDFAPVMKSKTRTATLSYQTIDNGEYIWEGVVVLPCNTKLPHYPGQDEMTAQLELFLNPPADDVVEQASEEEVEATEGRER